MLSRILQTIFLCFTVLLLTTGIALSQPLSDDMLMADRIADQDAALPTETAPDTQTAPVSQPDPSPQIDVPDSARQKNPQPTQADPSVPYDPYDYDAMREMNREIYGEAKDN